MLDPLDTFDPSDVDSAARLAYAAIKLAERAMRCIAADNAHLRMGRDDKLFLHQAIIDVLKVLNINKRLLEQE